MKTAILKTLTMFRYVLPILVGVLLLINLLNPLFQGYYSTWFTGNYLVDPLIGALAGSLSFGMPITSYIAGGELLHAGVSLLAITAFLMTWTTVGMAMLPLEYSTLGLRFALARNLSNFFLALAVAVCTDLTLGLLP
jgi:hypothetical protein